MNPRSRYAIDPNPKIYRSSSNASGMPTESATLLLTAGAIEIDQRVSSCQKHYPRLATKNPN